jgi:hypothetical protein
MIFLSMCHCNFDDDIARLDVDRILGFWAFVFQHNLMHFRAVVLPNVQLSAEINNV